jgi:hypothetical protein
MQILEALNIPDVDLLLKMYQPGAYYKARMSQANGLVTARILLTRGTKQGDPLLPVIFNLTINMMFRMLARAGHRDSVCSGTPSPQSSLGTAAHKRKTTINNKAFADDTALITHNTQGTNALLALVEACCNYSSVLDPNKKPGSRIERGR